jgi:hypothetical protein
MNSSPKKIWMTLGGLPLTMTFEWPFHRSTSGADFWVLHGDIRMEGSDGLHALVAVNLSATVREVLPSLEPKDAEAPVINALRKEVDRKQIEFVKSGKLLPVAFSSRHYDFKRQKWVFGKASDDAIAELIERKVYWETKVKTSPKPKEGLDGAPADEQQVPHRGFAPVQNDIGDGYKVWVADPTEAQYLETTPTHLLEVAGRLGATNGLIRMDGEFAQATAGLMNRCERFESTARAALEEIEKKHAFERG